MLTSNVLPSGRIMDCLPPLMASRNEIEMITDILAPPAVASAARATEDLRENILRSAVAEIGKPDLLV
jgi:hypothetical protein